MSDTAALDRATTSRMVRLREKSEYAFAMMDYLAARGYEIETGILDIFATALSPPHGVNITELEAAVLKAYVRLLTLLAGRASPEGLYLAQQFEAIDQPTDEPDESQVRRTLRWRINMMSWATV